MAPPRPPGKRRISVLEAVIVVVGFLAIIGYNRLNLIRLQRSLPNVNDKIVGEWKAERGPEHLVFRSDESVSMTVPPPASAGGESAAEGTGSPPPVTGKYKLTQGGRIYIQLMNGKKYHTTISPINPNRFDLIDSETDGVTTYDRVNAPNAAKEAPAAAAAPPTADMRASPAPPASTAEEGPAPPPVAAGEAPRAAPPPAAEREMSAAPPAAASDEAPSASPPTAEAAPKPPSAEAAPAAPKAEEPQSVPATKSSAAQPKKHR